MNITKEQIKEWLLKRDVSEHYFLNSNIEFIYDCIQDLSPKWVSIEDRLPNIGEQVIASCADAGFKKGLVVTAIYHPDKLFRDTISSTPLVIDRWMELPK